MSYQFRVESRSTVQVNKKACRGVADILRGHVVPADREESDLPHLARDLVPNFYFYVVGVCHQTSPRGLPPAEGIVAGRHRVGWDFLWSKFEQACLQDPARLSPETWSKETPASFERIFADAKLGFRLTDREGRVRLVRDMGDRLLEMGVRNVQDLYERSGGRVPGLLRELARFQAYRDPVEKKSIFFLSLMRNTGLWELVDPEVLEAPVDYHEVRGHLRIGTIQVLNEQLVEAIHLQKPVSESEDIAIRMATRSAIRTIADDVGITPSQAHYLFWNIFRAICLRDKPRCLSGTPSAIPERYRDMAVSGCPFTRTCRSFAAGEFPIEHQTETQYY